MKFIKFDTLYPSQYLEKRINEDKLSIRKMDFMDMTEWLIKLRLNFSDYYSYNLRQLGWEAKEFFILGKGSYLRKCGKEFFGSSFLFLYAFYKLFGVHAKKSLMETLISRIIDVEKPDVIFIREQSMISSLFWDGFRDRALVVSRMECGIPKYWSPKCFDIIYTNIDTYRSFFLSNRLITYSNYSGFDERVENEIRVIDDFDYDVVFVGGLGSPTFGEKTRFIEEVISKSKGSFSFAWWGYQEGADFSIQFPFLSQTYQGLAGGLDMFNIYYNAKIVINDYGIAAGGQGMNQRIYEVLGVGGFLLTRNSSMFNDWEGAIATFEDANDCLDKIHHFLQNEDERKELAQKGHCYVLQHFNYRDIMRKLSAELKLEYDRKFKESNMLV